MKKQMKFLLTFLAASAIASFTNASTTTAQVSGGLKWTGYGVGKSHTGDLSLKSGSVTLKGQDIQAGEFVFDTTTITYPNQRLSDHLKSADFFDAAKFPEIRFKITKVEALKTPGPKGETHKITGDLTVKGITKPHEMMATVKNDKGTWTAVAETEIADRTQFDIKYNSSKFNPVAKLGDKLIEDKIAIALNLTAK